jgi:hypothetical protein
LNEVNFQIFSIVHGSFGAALLALLVLSVWLDRSGDDVAFGTGLGISAVMQLLQAVFGYVIHRHFDGHLRATLVLRAPALARWTDRKEMIAVGALVLTWCAWGSHRLARRATQAQRFAAVATWTARAAGLCAFLAFAVGIVVAAALFGDGR